ncbi:MAG: hypothetical protein K2N38_05770 [Oscillospiraceae bacterium]|nr:hypothetical protein [Oscillospiraceae bacterium]
MKSRIVVCVLSLSVAIFSLSLGGCSNYESLSQNSTQIYSENRSDSLSQTEGTVNSQNGEISRENSSENSVSSVPAGETTFLIGLDSKAILTSEITRLENTDTTPEALTAEDLWAEIYCDGFAFLKEPSGTAYDSYNKPELFDGYNFLGNEIENTNEWKRVNIGDEICGLKIKNAAAHFTVNDFESYEFPERYFSNNGTGVELDGEMEIEGFLHVLPDNAFYTQDSRLVEFLPCESKLPIAPNDNPDWEKGYITRLELYTLYGNEDFLTCCDNGCYQLGYLDNIACSLDGIEKGDIAYVRATLDNICIVGNDGTATLISVERLSDILAHDEDII